MSCPCQGLSIQGLEALRHAQENSVCGLSHHFLLYLYFYHLLSSIAITSATAVPETVRTCHYLLGVTAEVTATPPPLRGSPIVFLFFMPLWVAQEDAGQRGYTVERRM